MDGLTYFEGLGHLIRFKLGRHHDHPDIHCLRGHEITIEMDHPMPLQFDGELYGPVQEAHIHLLPGALRVLVPNQPGLKLFQNQPASDSA
jgi:diacylglycerol kinase family enzyme